MTQDLERSRTAWPITVHNHLIPCARESHPPSTLSLPPNMAPAFDKCKERPAQIDTILNGLDRYNPETTEIFREYVNQQCEEKFFDAYACLALLKL